MLHRLENQADTTSLLCFRFPSNQEEQADTGLLFDGQGLFDEQPPEVTSVQPAEAPAASSQEAPPPVAEPEQHEGTAANELDDPPVRYILRI